MPRLASCGGGDGWTRQIKAAKHYSGAAGVWLCSGSKNGGRIIIKVTGADTAKQYQDDQHCFMNNPSPTSA